jgi:hypothetical protein
MRVTKLPGRGAPQRGRLVQVRRPHHLGQPRYTCRQVWNKQRKDEILLDVQDVAVGYETRMRWNEASRWVWSETTAHEPRWSPPTTSPPRRPVRAERGGHFEFCRRLAPVLDGRGEVPVRPAEVIEPVRIIGVLHAGHHQRDRYGGHASSPGADHWE